MAINARTQTRINIFMANSLFSLLVLLSAIHFVSAQRRVPDIIRQGSSLTPTGNSSWLSPSGLFAFGFYPQGDNHYDVGIFLAGPAVVWTANRDNPPVPENVTLHLSTEGKLILQQSQDSTTDVVVVDRSISSASMLNSGNFVLYGSNQEKIWQSFDHPTTPSYLVRFFHRIKNYFLAGPIQIIPQGYSDL